MVVDDARRHHRSLAMAWLDFSKAFDSLSQEWILHMLRIYRFHPDIVEVLRIGYACGPQRASLVSHLWYMDDVKLYASGDTQLASLVNIVENVGGAVGMALSPTKCAKLVCPSGRPREEDTPLITVGGASEIAPLPHNTTYAYLGMREFLGMAEDNIKPLLRTEFARRLDLVANSFLNSKNLVRAFNAYVVPVMSYGLCLIHWTVAELAAIDRSVRQARLAFVCICRAVRVVVGFCRWSSCMIVRASDWLVTWRVVPSS